MSKPIIDSFIFSASITSLQEEMHLSKLKNFKVFYNKKKHQSIT